MPKIEHNLNSWEINVIAISLSFTRERWETSSSGFPEDVKERMRKLELKINELCRKTEQITIIGE